MWCRSGSGAASGATRCPATTRRGRCGAAAHATMARRARRCWWAPHSRVCTRTPATGGTGPCARGAPAVASLWTAGPWRNTRRSSPARRSWPATTWRCWRTSGTTTGSPGWARRSRGQDARLVERDKLIADAELAIDNKERQRDAATHPSRRERFVVQLVDAEARLSALLTERDGVHETGRRERLKPSDVDELSALWDSPTTPAAKRRTIVRQCVPGGFYVRPVGKGARLRGEAIFTRFYTKGGDA